MEATIFAAPEVDYAKPVPDPDPGRDLSAYIGEYENDIYGTLLITAGADDELELTVGPQDTTFALQHYDGDTYWFMPSGGNNIGENALFPSGVLFDVPEAGEESTSVTVEWLEGASPGLGIGTFSRG
ncbi:MAG: DUF3471 domain-containing protein [Ornithinimicrobium sp.]